VLDPALPMRGGFLNVERAAHGPVIERIELPS